MKSNFHHTLITLAIVDIIFLAVIIVDTQRFDLDLENQLFIMLFPYVWNPLKNILMSFEAFLMMSISTERCLAIRRPLKYRKRSTLKSTYFVFNGPDVDVARLSEVVCLPLKKKC